MRHHTKNLLERKNIALTNQLIRGLVIGFSLVAISAFAILYIPLRSQLTQAVYSVAPSVWRAGEAIDSALGALLTNFKDKNKLVKENEILNKAIATMETKVLDRNLLAEKVAKLEESLGRSRDDDRVVASILVGPGRSPYDTLVIDAGEEEGINAGNIVVYSGSGVIGEVVEATRFSSKIKLYSSPREEHIVTVGPGYIPVLAVGRGMGNFEAKVPQDSKVAVGDNVISVKKGLIFGTVSLIEEKPAEPFMRVLFRMPFNITEIQTVEVIVDKR